MGRCSPESLDQDGALAEQYGSQQAPGLLRAVSRVTTIGLEGPRMRPNESRKNKPSKNRLVDRCADELFACAVTVTMFTVGVCVLAIVLIT